MGAKLRSTQEGRDPGTRGGNTEKSDTSASEPWPPGHQRKFESSEIAGSPLGRVPFLGEGTLSRGGLMVKRRKEAGVLQENTTDSDETPAPPHCTKASIISETYCIALPNRRQHKSETPSPPPQNQLICKSENDTFQMSRKRKTCINTSLGRKQSLTAQENSLFNHKAEDNRNKI